MLGYNYCKNFSVVSCFISLFLKLFKKLTIPFCSANPPLQHMFLWRNPFDGYSIVILLFWFNYIWFGLIYLRSLNTEIWDCRYSSWFVNYVLMSLSLMSPFKTRFYYFLCCCWRLKIQSLSYIQIHFSLRCRPLRKPTFKVNFMSISYILKKRQDFTRQFRSNAFNFLKVRRFNIDALKYVEAMEDFVEQYFSCV